MADRDFKGVWIPKKVWLDSRLSMLDKGILAEIDSLDNGADGCFASNEHLAEFCQCSERKASDSVNKLVLLGYVRVASFDGRKRFLRSCIEKSAMQGSKNCEADSQFLLHSNTSNKPSIKPLNKHMSSQSENDLQSGFVEFWKVYPNKVKKKDALTAWKSGRCEQIADRIIADVKERCSTEWKGDGAQYVPHPTTYLHQRRWEDETRPTERKGWHNPALDYAQRGRDGKSVEGETHIWTAEEMEGI